MMLVGWFRHDRLAASIALENFLCAHEFISRRHLSSHSSKILWLKKLCFLDYKIKIYGDERCCLLSIIKTQSLSDFFKPHKC